MMMNNKKQIVMLALIVIAAVVTGTAIITTTIQSVAQAKNGTGCTPGSNGFIHSHGKCFHPENLLKGNETD